MEPRREEAKVATPHGGQKPKRFRLVRLEDRIAPCKGGNGTHNCVASNCGTCFCCYNTLSIE
jgi:hypothetical protein